MNEFSWFAYLVIGLLVAYILLKTYQQIKQITRPSPLVPLLLGNPEVKIWLQNNVTGERIADLKAIRRQFGLDLVTASELLNHYYQQK